MIVMTSAMIIKNKMMTKVVCNDTAADSDRTRKGSLAAKIAHLLHFSSYCCTTFLPNSLLFRPDVQEQSDFDKSAPCLCVRTPSSLFSEIPDDDDGSGHKRLFLSFPFLHTLYFLVFLVQKTAQSI